MAISVKSQTINGVKWSGIENFSTQIITFIIGIVLARLLAPSDYGIVGLMSVFMAFSNVFINSGFTTALIRKPDMTDVDCSTVFYCNILISVICYTILFVCSPLIASFFKTPILTSVIKVYCLTLIIGAFESVQITRLTKNLQFKSLAIINVFTSITSGIIGITLAYLGWGVWAIVWQSVLNGILHGALIWFASKWNPGFVFSKDSFRKLFSFGKNILFGNLLYNIYNQLTPLIISKYYSLADLAQYNRGTSYAYLPAETVINILQKVTFPILSKLQDDEERLIYVYRKYVRSSSMIIMFMLILLAALAKPLVLFMITDKWAECILYLQLYVFAACFQHISRLNLNLLNVVGRSDLVLKLEMTKRIISVILLLVAVPFGVTAICISMVLYEQIDLTFNTYYSGKLFGLGYFKQMKDYLQYFIASIICCLPAFLLTYSKLPYLVIIFLGGVLSIVLYAGYLFLSKNSEFLDLVKPVREKVKSRLHGSFN